MYFCPPGEFKPADLMPETRDNLVRLFDMTLEGVPVVYGGLAGVELAELAATELDVRKDPEATFMMDAVRSFRYHRMLQPDVETDEVIAGMRTMAIAWGRRHEDPVPGIVERTIIAHDVAVEDHGFYRLDEKYVDELPLPNKIGLAMITRDALDITAAYGEKSDLMDGTGQFVSLLDSIVAEDRDCFGPWAYVELEDVARMLGAKDVGMGEIDAVKKAFERLSKGANSDQSLNRTVAYKSLSQLRAMYPDQKRYKRQAARLAKTQAVLAIRGEAGGANHSIPEEWDAFVEATAGTRFGPDTIESAINVRAQVEQIRENNKEILQRR